MAFKEVSTVRKYYKLKECKAGQVLAEGTYQGTEISKFDKPQYLFSCGDETVVLNGSGNLPHAMKTVKEGDLVRITYKGTKPLDKGHKFAGTECHQFSVAVDTDKPAYVDDMPEEFMGTDEELPF